MFKFLLIVGLVLYVTYKIGSLFFKAGAASQQFRHQRNKNFNGNQNPTSDKSQTKNGNFKGGEYIDYEEVK